MELQNPSRLESSKTMLHQCFVHTLQVKNQQTKFLIKYLYQTEKTFFMVRFYRHFYYIAQCAKVNLCDLLKRAFFIDGFSYRPFHFDFFIVIIIWKTYVLLISNKITLLLLALLIHIYKIKTKKWQTLQQLKKSRANCLYLLGV